MADKKRKPEEENYFPIFSKKLKQQPSSEPSSDNTGPHLSLKEFALLLDFSAVRTEEEISGRFKQISRALLYDIRLVARKSDGKETEFVVLEAEFYLQIEGLYEDPFTHGSEEQKVSGRWYFHRAPRRSEDSRRSLTDPTSYRSGSRKGMDLTFGGPLPNWIYAKYVSPSASESRSSTSNPQPVERFLCGGILLRSLRQLGPGSKVISGPSLLVDQILNVSGAATIEELVEQKWEKNICAFLSEEGSPSTCLYLKEVEAGARKTPKIYYSPRIGLDLSHPGTTGPSTLPLHPRIQFLPKPNRFFVYPDQLVANGRPQTFLGVLQACIESSNSLEAGLSKPSLSGQISGLTGLKDSTAAKYLTEYKSGRKSGINFIESVVGPNGKGASNSPATYLKMMGTLSTIQRL